jgi:signal-transduction protein with cAMP-binding, CBS, and nucleotidyltransferase domain
MIDKLKKLEFFRAFDENDLKDLAPHVKTETHQAEDILFREGDDGDCMYIIEEGQVDIVKQNKTLSMFTDAMSLEKWLCLKIHRGARTQSRARNVRSTKS